MYLMINKATMTFVCSARGFQELAAIAVIDHPEAHADIFPQDDKRHYSSFTELELKLLYRNTTGGDLDVPWQPGEAYKKLLQACYDLGLQVKADTRGLAELEKKAAKAMPEETMDRAAPTRGNSAVKATPSQPRAKAPAGPITRPKAGSATGRVWEIADAVFAEGFGDSMLRTGDGAVILWKRIRDEVLERCVAEGINPATAQVQYGKWKGSKEAG